MDCFRKHLILFYLFSEEAKRHEKAGGADEKQNRRFLQCPGSVTVTHLKKFIATKYGLDQSFLIDIIYKEDLIPEDQTLIDIAYSYNWRKVSDCKLIIMVSLFTWRTLETLQYVHNFDRRLTINHLFSP